MVSVGIVRGMVSPERSLTNNWKFSGVDVLEVEEEMEEEREGRMVGGCSAFRAGEDRRVEWMVGDGC